MSMNFYGIKQVGFAGSRKTANQRRFYLVPGLSLLIVLESIAACAYSAGGWRQSDKNEAMTRADYALCKGSAKETTLTLQRSEQQGFGTAGTKRPGTFNPRRDDILAIADRSNTTTLYDALLETCMVRKGYNAVGTP